MIAGIFSPKIVDEGLLVGTEVHMTIPEKSVDTLGPFKTAVTAVRQQLAILYQFRDDRVLGSEVH